MLVRSLALLLDRGGCGGRDCRSARDWRLVVCGSSVSCLRCWREGGDWRVTGSDWTGVLLCCMDRRGVQAVGVSCP
eukprot:6470665-Amphidinium_carterae.5